MSRAGERGEPAHRDPVAGIEPDRGPEGTLGRGVERRIRGAPGELLELEPALRQTPGFDGSGGAVGAGLAQNAAEESCGQDGDNQGGDEKKSSHGWGKRGEGSPGEPSPYRFLG